MRLYLVLTIDQRSSRHGSADLVPKLLKALAQAFERREPFFRSPPPPALPFERTVGDEVQGVLDLDLDSLTLTLPRVLRTVATDDEWWVGVGIGRGRLGRHSAESDGPAFYAARHAVENAKLASNAEVGCALAWGLTDDRKTNKLRERYSQAERVPGRSSVEILGDGSNEAVLFERLVVAGAALALHSQLLSARTRGGREAVEAVENYRSRAKAAEQLKISESALSQRLRAARWRTESQSANGLAFSLDAVGQELVKLERAQ